MTETATRSSAFRPHGWLQGPLAQMAAGAAIRAGAVRTLRVERLVTPDDDFVELGWVNEQARGPIAVLVHGLGGGLRSTYVHAMAGALARHGWTSVVLQLRGAGPEPNRRPHIFHHADTRDLRWVCHGLRRRVPGRPLAAIGWSLGGSIVLNALGEDGRDAPVDAAAVVSAPLQLLRCAEYLRTGRARLYQELMLRYVKTLLRRKFEGGWPAPLDGAAVLAARDFLQFGDAFIAPLCGFRDGREYCRRADPGRQLPGIRRPTLIVQARDDPFLGPAALPRAPWSRQVRLELAERGGHVGFVAPGPRGRPCSWLEPRVTRFLRAVVQRRPRRTP